VLHRIARPATARRADPRTGPERTRVARCRDCVTSSRMSSPTGR
jgi:hypothetical protein